MAGRKGFISFGDVASSGTAWSGSHTPAQISLLSPVYTGSSDSIQQLSKKLTKNSPTTRMKALVDLVAILGSPEAEKDKTLTIEFLPHFCFVYERLWHDNNRKIRENLQLILQAMIHNIQSSDDKQALGPYMGALIGPWWCSASDPVKEVRTVAITAFEKAIPGAKRRQKVLHYLSPCIIRFTKKMLASTVGSLATEGVGASGSSEDEAEDRHERVTQATIRCLGRLLIGLSEQDCRSLMLEGVVVPAALASLDLQTGTRVLLREVLSEQLLWKKMSTHPTCTTACLELLEHICKASQPEEKMENENKNKNTGDMKDMKESKDEQNANADGNGNESVPSVISPSLKFADVCDCDLGWLFPALVQVVMRSMDLDQPRCVAAIHAFLALAKAFPECWGHVDIVPRTKADGTKSKGGLTVMKMLQKLLLRAPATGLGYLLPIVASLPGVLLSFLSVCNDKNDKKGGGSSGSSTSTTVLESESPLSSSSSSSEQWEQGEAIICMLKEVLDIRMDPEAVRPVGDATTLADFAASGVEVMAYLLLKREKETENQENQSNQSTSTSCDQVELHRRAALCCENVLLWTRLVVAPKNESHSTKQQSALARVFTQLHKATLKCENLKVSEVSLDTSGDTSTSGQFTREMWQEALWGPLSKQFVGLISADSSEKEKEGEVKGNGNGKILNRVVDLVKKALPAQPSERGLPKANDGGSVALSNISTSAVVGLRHVGNALRESALSLLGRLTEESLSMLRQKMNAAEVDARSTANVYIQKYTYSGLTLLCKLHSTDLGDLCEAGQELKVFRAVTSSHVIPLLLEINDQALLLDLLFMLANLANTACATSEDSVDILKQVQRRVDVMLSQCISAHSLAGAGLIFTLFASSSPVQSAEQSSVSLLSVQALEIHLKLITSAFDSNSVDRGDTDTDTGDKSDLDDIALAVRKAPFVERVSLVSHAINRHTGACGKVRDVAFESVGERALTYASNGDTPLNLGAAAYISSICSILKASIATPTLLEPAARDSEMLLAFFGLCKQASRRHATQGRQGRVDTDMFYQAPFVSSGLEKYLISSFLQYKDKFEDKDKEKDKGSVRCVVNERVGMLARAKELRVSLPITVSNWGEAQTELVGRLSDPLLRRFLDSLAASLHVEKSFNDENKDENKDVVDVDVALKLGGRLCRLSGLYESLSGSVSNADTDTYTDKDQGIDSAVDEGERSFGVRQTALATGLQDVRLWQRARGEDTLATFLSQLVCALSSRQSLSGATQLWLPVLTSPTLLLEVTSSLLPLRVKAKAGEGEVSGEAASRLWALIVDNVRRASPQDRAKLLLGVLPTDIRDISGGSDKATNALAAFGSDQDRREAVTAVVYLVLDSVCTSNAPASSSQLLTSVMSVSQSTTPPFCLSVRNTLWVDTPIPADALVKGSRAWYVRKTQPSPSSSPSEEKGAIENDENDENDKNDSSASATSATSVMLVKVQGTVDCVHRETGKAPYYTIVLDDTSSEVQTEWPRVLLHADKEEKGDKGDKEKMGVEGDSFGPFPPESAQQLILAMAREAIVDSGAARSARSSSEEDQEWVILLQVLAPWLLECLSALTMLDKNNNMNKNKNKKMSTLDAGMCSMLSALLVLVCSAEDSVGGTESRKITDAVLGASRHAICSLLETKSNKSNAEADMVQRAAQILWALSQSNSGRGLGLWLPQVLASLDAKAERVVQGSRLLALAPLPPAERAEELSSHGALLSSLFLSCADGAGRCKDVPNVDSHLNSNGQSQSGAQNGTARKHHQSGGGGGAGAGGGSPANTSQIQAPVWRGLLVSAKSFLRVCLVKECDLLQHPASASLRGVCVMLLRLYWACMAANRSLNKQRGQRDVRNLGTTDPLYEGDLPEEWEISGLRLCLDGFLSVPSVSVHVHQHESGKEVKVTSWESSAFGRLLGSEPTSTDVTDTSADADAAMAIHYCLLGREKMSTTELLNSALEGDHVNRLSSFVSIASHSPLQRLVACKLLDCWYGTGCDMQFYLENFLKSPQGAEETESGEEEFLSGAALDAYREEQEEREAERDKALFVGVVGVELANELSNRIESLRAAAEHDERYQQRQRLRERRMLRSENNAAAATKKRLGGEMEVEEEDDGEEEDEEEEDQEEAEEEGGDSTDTDSLGLVLVWLICLCRIDATALRQESNGFVVRARCGTYLKRSQLHTVLATYLRKLTAAAMGVSSNGSGNSGNNGVLARFQGGLVTSTLQRAMVGSAVYASATEQTCADDDGDIEEKMEEEGEREGKEDTCEGLRRLCADFRASGDETHELALLDDLALFAFYRMTVVLPAVTRSWYTFDCSRAHKQSFSKFVEAVVQPALVGRELDLVREAQSAGAWDGDEMSVTGLLSSSGEGSAVLACIMRDDAKLEIKIKIPPHYPLKNVAVETVTRSGVPEAKWRRWAFQIIQLLSMQDGTIIDGVLLWKKNMDNELDGVEPCPICYSTLHSKFMCLPTLGCPTCSNKFHPQCLNQWFKQSGKYKCVICQQPFFQDGR